MLAPAAARALWTRSRGLLRSLLGGYLGMEPRALRFTAGSQGKPALRGQAPPAGSPTGGRAAAGGGLSFNVSHSGAHGPLRVLRQRRRGRRRGGWRERESTRSRSPSAPSGQQEARRLAALHPAAREREFLAAWVRHEAQLKCLGVGLAGASDPHARALALGGRARSRAPRGGRGGGPLRPCAAHCWDWPPAARAPVHAGRSPAGAAARAARGS